jgi:superfamily II DNA or RNA helicase
MTDVLDALPRSNRAYGSHLKKFENREALRLFKAKHVPYLVAMKALDEGLDVPECDTCILVASDATSRVYIQRRGRILRNPKESDYKLAKIYDMFLLPPRFTGTNYITYYDSVKSLLEHEIHRLKILAEAAQNLTTVRQEAEQLLQTYIIYHLTDDNEPANCSKGKHGTA